MMSAGRGIMRGSPGMLSNAGQRMGVVAGRPLAGRQEW